MARLCERPGCSEPGAVAYGMNAPDLVFWMAALGADGDADDRVLCRRHADAMVVPRGWTLDDRREPVPRLFRPPTARTTSDARGAEPRRRRPGPAPTEPLPLDESAAPAVAAPDVPAGAEPPAESWAPAFDTDDDLDGLLSVESPLLARAFRGEGRPRR